MAALAEVPQTPIVGDSLIGPVMDIEMARQRLVQFQQFIKEYLVEGEDYGTIPGTPKPTLLKPGSDKLCELYGLADDYQVVQRTEDFEKNLFDYEIKCILTSKRNGLLVSTGMGSCNSFEKRYRWRDSQRKCPNCGKETIIKGKEEFGGGWICFAKKGGCGAKFSDKDPGILEQVVGKVQNEDVADLKNTILKMAKKRAKIDATLSATRSSGLFTQDMEDWEPYHAPAQQPPQPQTAQAHTQTPPSAQPKTEPKKLNLDPHFTPKLFGNVLLCQVSEVMERKTKDDKKQDFLALELAPPYEGRKLLFCFHQSLFEALKTSPGQICRFAIMDGGKNTLSICEVQQIGEVLYKDGKPFQPEPSADGGADPFNPF